MLICADPRRQLMRMRKEQLDSRHTATQRLAVALWTRKDSPLPMQVSLTAFLASSMLGQVVPGLKSQILGAIFSVETRT